MIALVRPEFGTEEIEAVERVLKSGMVVQGPEVAAFEEEFSSVVAGRTCVAVNSGTSALHLALVASGIGGGDEVVVPSFTFAATANAVRLCGATPVFADIDPETFNLDPSATAAAVTSRTAALMPVHLFGNPAPMSDLRQIAERHGLLLVEDAAQAHGASLDEVPAGALGDVAAFSFYATKNMTTGEGGMVVVRDPSAARAVRLLRNQGMEKQYLNEVVGYNMRMTDLAAAIGQRPASKTRRDEPAQTRSRRGLRQGVRRPGSRVGDTERAAKRRALVSPVHDPRRTQGPERQTWGPRTRCVVRTTDTVGGRIEGLLSGPRPPPRFVRHGDGTTRDTAAPARRFSRYPWALTFLIDRWIRSSTRY